jgi:hypothetical protein
MITATDAVNMIYTLLSVRPLFKHFHPDGYDGNFTVINTLGVPKDPIQIVEVNVNCYAKDLDKQRGIPDLKTLNDMTGSVITDIHNYSYNGISIEFSMSNIFREESINCHFMNLRFQLLYTSN